MGDFADDFMRGWWDCDKGIPSKADESDEYLRGYGSCYQNEQNMSELTK